MILPQIRKQNDMLWSVNKNGFTHYSVVTYLNFLKKPYSRESDSDILLWLKIQFHFWVQSFCIPKETSGKISRRPHTKNQIPACPVKT